MTDFSSMAEIAAEFGVSVRALRFYEQRGLLHPARAGDTVCYTSQDRTRLALILKAKQLGFSLAEIERLIQDAATRKLASATPVEDMLEENAIVRHIQLLEDRRLAIQFAIDALLETLRVRKGSERRHVAE